MWTGLASWLKAYGVLTKNWKSNLMKQQLPQNGLLSQSHRSINSASLT
jgi:hypothetical protein